MSQVCQYLQNLSTQSTTQSQSDWKTTFTCWTGEFVWSVHLTTSWRGQTRKKAWEVTKLV